MVSNRAQVPYQTTLFGSRRLSVPAQAAGSKGASSRLRRSAVIAWPDQWKLSLLMSPNRPQPPAMAAVASFVAIDRTRLTAARQPLERPGLVTVAANPEDRRSRWMTLTPNRRTRLAKAVPIWERPPPGDRGRSSEWRPESPSRQFERFVQRLRESTLASRGKAQKRPTLR
jgi:DNA-binding MarR family transcriptional regulator